MQLPRLSPTRFSPPAGSSAALNPKRFADMVKGIARTEVERDNKLVFAVSGPVCDGSPNLNLLNSTSCCTTCGGGGSGTGTSGGTGTPGGQVGGGLGGPVNGGVLGGQLVIAVVTNGMPTLASVGVSRSNASSAGSSPIGASADLTSPCVAYKARMREHRRFVDSVGNVWDPDGQYDAAGSASFTVDNWDYTGGGEAGIAYIRNLTTGVEVAIGDNLDYSANSYFYFEEPSTPTGRERIVAGLYSGTTKCGFWHSSDVLFGIERKVVAGGTGNWIPTAVIRRIDASYTALSRVVLSTVGVATLGKVNVTASTDGTFWQHGCGSKTLTHWQWDGTNLTVIERLTLGGGGTAWVSSGSSATMVKQIYV